MANHSRVDAGSTSNTSLELVGLRRFGNRYPSEISGEMQRRVGIAGSLANYPSVLPINETFGALDAQAGLMMQECLLDT